MRQTKVLRTHFENWQELAKSGYAGKGGREKKKGKTKKGVAR